MDEGVFVLNPHKLDDYGLEAWPPTAFYAPKQRPIVALKISKSQNKLLKSLFVPKYEQNILRISGLASKERSNKKNRGILSY